MKKDIESFFEDAGKWQKEYHLLRKLLLDCSLVEEFKWGKPCYTYKDKNIVLIHGFKEYCALLFHKGVLLKDTEGLLVQQTKNVQSARQLRFTGIAEIKQLADEVKAYVYEAVEVEKVGLKVQLKKTSEFEMVAEFKEALSGNSDLKSAFETLTPGRQRGYLLYFSGAKLSKTRQSRIEQCTPKILNGVGLHDHYKGKR